MTDYEVLLAVGEKESEEDQKKLIKELENKIEAKKGSVASTDSWGKRALAYEIGGNKNAFYWLLNFSSGSSTPKELIDSLRINDQVLRFIINKKEAKKAKTKKKSKA